MMRTSNKNLFLEPFQCLQNKSEIATRNIARFFFKLKNFFIFFQNFFYIYYLAGYPVIWPAGYPAKSVSGTIIILNCS